MDKRVADDEEIYFYDTDAKRQRCCSWITIYEIENEDIYVVVELHYDMGG
jgi:hypothetical protein